MNANDFQDAPANSRIVISGHHTEVGDALTASVEEMIRTAASKYCTRAVEAHVTFSKGAHGQRFGCHIHVHAGKGMFHEGTGEAQLAQAAFKMAFERVSKQMRRQKRALREDKPLNVGKATLFRGHEDRDGAGFAYA